MMTRQIPDTTTADDDPELAALCAEFRAKLPARATAIEVERIAGRLPEVAKVAHKLVGAAGTYGFADIAAAARRVEDLAKANGDAGDIAAATVALSDLCSRASTGA